MRAIIGIAILSILEGLVWGGIIWGIAKVWGHPLSFIKVWSTGSLIMFPIQLIAYAKQLRKTL